MSDAFIIGESWISEHFFANDGTASFHAEVLKLVKDWRDTESAGHATARSRFREARLELISLMGQASDVAGETAQNGARSTETTEQFAATRRLNERLFDVLGFNRPHLTRDENGPLTRISTLGLTDAPPLAVISARPVADVTELLAKDQHTLAQPYIAHEDADPIQSVARLLSDLFTQTSSPRFALVLAGNLALIAEQERWMEGRYLAVDIQQVAEANDVRRGGEIDRAIACLGVDSLAPDAEGTIWWQSILETSVSHTVGVSEELRTGVRESIEILASEVVRRRAEQGLEPLPSDQAQPLASQALRFLYRILFLLYAEASPELGVLPVGDPAYEAGYSLDRLRELALVKIEDQRSLNGTHLYESLATLFRLVDQGHAPNGVTEPTGSDDLTFHSLRADLFEAAATAYIDEVKLGNEALQEVLRRLLVKSGSRSDSSGFISYADLGINQLGAVYEGLMSYTGFFAEQDLYEVAPGGDSSKGSWVVPVDRAHGIAEKDFVRREDPTTGESKAVLHARGSFVFRLSGRERQQSASYYSPEVITRFTVGQALEELLDQGETTSAQEILDLKICEPALGSGAFAIEAVRQLADQYLRRREAELGTRVEPDERPSELQKIKAYIALHNVYGVDLNGTAIELAEISLWLDTMHRGLDAPWFGLHLRRGNSLIGARRATFRSDQVLNKTWLKEVPRDVPLTDRRETGIHHFLLPSEGWGAAISAKEGRSLAPEAVKALRDWRRSVQRKPTKKHVDRLEKVAARIETLWDLALRRLRIAEAQARRSIDVWGAEDLPAGGAVSREEIEEYLASEWGSFQRLKIIMDAWCALWFWPLTERLTTWQVIKDGVTSVERITPPSFDEWLGALEALVGTHQERKKYAQPGETLSQAQEWDDLNTAEQLDMQFSGALDLKQVRAQHPWLEVCEAVADEHGFFHWELFFGPVFADRGGFDLQVGNPPWVRPDEDTDALLAEGDPWWQLVSKAPVSERKIRRENTLELPGIRDLVIDGSVDVAATRRAVSDPQHYPHLVGLRPDLYRCFMEQTSRHSNDSGITSLVHPESHFVDEKAQTLRGATYRRLRRHWQFINELRLYEEIDHHVNYGVHVYGSEQAPSFLQASSLYHPDTVQRSIDHNGYGGEPGLKDENTGTWDLRPHQNRIIQVDREVLSSWHALLESDDVPVEKTRMVYTVNRAAGDVLEKIARAPRIGDLQPKFSQGWNETTDFNNGRFSKTWGPVENWQDAILQGPHLHVATPFFKSPNSTMRHNQDWTDIDLETLEPAALPVTSYKPAGDRDVYDANYTHWDINGESVPARNHYRIAWRSMAANTGERTLIAACIPPGAAPINNVRSVGLPVTTKTPLLNALASASSLLSDFIVRSVPRAHILLDQFSNLPRPDAGTLKWLAIRLLRLNCLTNAYAELWSAVWEELAPDDSAEPHPFTQDAWTGGIDYPGRPSLGGVGPEWTSETPLRRETDRRQALIEIDALVALSLGITADELCTIYRTQFPVLYGYDHGKYVYDANGRLVPTSIQTVWRKKGDDLSIEERTATHPGSGIDYVYELPFTRLDREADFRAAYTAFSKTDDAERNVGVN